MSPIEPAAAISRRDQLLALTVVAIWGSNFVAMKWGLALMSPLALCSWRFLLSFVPACLLIRRPQAGLPLLAAFGVLTGVGQFGLLCIAMRDMIDPGLASVVVQTQAFFNVALAALVLKEQVRPIQIAGCLVAAAGLALIAAGAGTASSIGGMVLVLLAALSWATCNVLLRRANYAGDLVAFLVWSSPFAAGSLAILSLVFESPQALATPIVAPIFDLWAILGWQAFANTIFGYAVWNSLIRRYSLSRIGPLTLLVPLVAMSLSAWLLGERLGGREISAAVLIFAGLAVPFLWDKRRWASRT